MLHALPALPVLQYNKCFQVNIATLQKVTQVRKELGLYFYAEYVFFITFFSGAVSNSLPIAKGNGFECTPDNASQV